MADIRIKDLTTTASSTASDDFIAVDGTTNGTRKLSAFSPTFGGNVVVTGTLTSNSTLSTAAGLIAQNADFNAGYIILRGYGSQDGGLVFFGQSANNNFINSNATTISTSIAGSAVSNNVAAGFRVLTTTASTSTSSGALVVSGGVGVAGKVNAGSFGTTGTTLSAVQNVSVSTTAVDISGASEVGGLYFVTGYNQSGGAQGSWLLLVRGTVVTTVSSDNNTSLTVTFSTRTSGATYFLQAATASGTLVTNAFAVTRG